MKWMQKAYRWLYPLPEKQLPIKVLDYFSNWKKVIREINPSFSLGGQMAVLSRRDAPLDRRIEALGQTASMNYGLRNPILRSLLPEPVDELRLLAFQILEEQEKRLTKKIQRILDLVEATKTEQEIYQGYKRLGQLYFEFVYKNLVQPELRAFMLNSSLEYTKNALEGLQHDGTLWSILGRLYYLTDEIKQANHAFKQAQKYYALDSHTIPYLAEEDFFKKEYHLVKNLFKHKPALVDLPTVGPVAQFWIECEPNPPEPYHA